MYFTVFATLLAHGQSDGHALNKRDSNSSAQDARQARSNLDESPFKLKKGDNEFGVCGGGSWTSPTVIGTVEERKFLTFGLRYGRIFAASRRVAYEYTIDVIPTAIVFQPAGQSSAYGAGISPIGFKFNFRRHERVKPFVGLSGGFLYFNQPTPVNAPGATRFNFTFDFGGGIQVFVQPKKAVTLGYRFQHISNAYISDVNPGLDANVFYAGFSVFK